MCRRIGSGSDPFAPAGTDAEDSDDPNHYYTNDGGTSRNTINCALMETGLSRAASCT